MWTSLMLPGRRWPLSPSLPLFWSIFASAPDRNSIPYRRFVGVARRRRGEGERKERDGRARDFSSNASCKVRVLISTEKRNGRRTDGNHAARRTDGRTDHDGDEAASGPSNLKSSGGPPPPRREHGSAPTTNTVSAASNRTVKVKSSKSKKQV